MDYISARVSGFAVKSFLGDKSASAATRRCARAALPFLSIISIFKPFGISVYNLYRSTRNAYFRIVKSP
jgi:hypothetical protein